MRYRLLGRSGLRVSELALGTMTFGEAWGWGASREESRRIFDAFAARAGNFVDTSNNYTDGEAETFVGEFLGSERERFVVGTKYSLSTRRDDPNGGGNHRKNLVQSLEGSLRRLGTDYVDLLWLHMWDGMTPVEEVMRGLDDLVRAGKVLYVGLSDLGATPSQVATAWIRQRSGNIIPIIGARSLQQAEEALGVLDVQLPAEVVDLLDRAAPIDLGFPRSFLESDGVRELTFGTTFDSIDV